jgi:hypothetical protein
MRPLFLIAFVLVLSTNIRAQIILELLAGNRHVHYISYVQKDLDSTGKWNFFNLNRFTFNYKDNSRNTVAIEVQISYKFKRWLGLSTGGAFFGELFVPNIGLSLSLRNKKENLFLQMYPTLGITRRQLIPSVLGIFVYTSAIRKRLGLTSEIIFYSDPFKASQILRISVDYNAKIKLGIGADFSQNLETKNFTTSIGPFCRFNF